MKSLGYVFLAVLCLMGCGDKSTDPKLTPSPDPPAAPSLAVGDVDNTGGAFTLSWSAVSTATSYELEEDVNRAFSNPRRIYQGAENQHRVTETIIGQPYHYRVRAANDGGQSPWSNVVFVSFEAVPATDTVSPVINDVAVSATSTTAFVTWNTDEPASGLVIYRISGSNHQQQSSNPQLKTSHRVILTGLAPSTNYTFQIRSMDQAGNAKQTADILFSTLSVLTISDEVVTVTNPTTAVVRWKTNVPANSVVNYGLNSGQYSSRITQSALVTSHALTLRNLSPSTVYFYTIQSTDENRNVQETLETTFITLSAPVQDITPPVITNVKGEATGATTAVITWTTNELANSLVTYRIPTGNSPILTSTDGAYVTSHHVRLTNLSPATPYVFSVESVDQAGNKATSHSGLYLFTTDPLLPPVLVSPPSGNKIEQPVTLKWNPVQNAARYEWEVSQFQEIRADGSFIQRRFGGTQSAIGANATSGTIPAGQDGSLYFWHVRAQDAEGNWSKWSVVWRFWL